jgi:hypothetical protein
MRTALETYRQRLIKDRDIFRGYAEMHLNKLTATMSSEKRGEAIEKACKNDRHADEIDVILSEFP